MTLKLAAGLIAGVLTQLGTASLQPPWGLVVGALAVAAAYVADHDAMAARMRKS